MMSKPFMKAVPGCDEDMKRDMYRAERETKRGKQREGSWRDKWREYGMETPSQFWQQTENKSDLIMRSRRSPDNKRTVVLSHE